jgi:phosphoribosyl 1,2-cyclic phosphodiesterase
LSDFRIISLASSSEGNCFFVIAGENNFLIDFGISPSTLFKKLRFLRINSMPSSLLISHEHSDHTSGIYNFCKKFPLTICANAPTLKRLNLDRNLKIERKVFSTGKVFEIEKVKIKPFRIHHDAAEPVGFNISYRKHKVVYLLDTGKIKDEQLKEVADADLVIIDSNYDNLSLSQGKYPESVKKRILRTGHLSNEIVGNVILNHTNPETEFWLGHMSKDNNSPALASMTVNYILKCGREQKKKFKILPRKAIGPVWEPIVFRQYNFIF